MFEVRPGITGWAQVNGRKKVEWYERIKLNIWYVENVSMFLDIKIIFMTFLKVLSNADNVSEGSTVNKENRIPMENASAEDDNEGQHSNK